MSSYKKKICVKQRDIADCGAACLMSISAFYGLHIPLSKIRQYACTDKKGTTIKGIVEAAEKLGFISKGVKGNYDSIKKIPKPAIAHLKLKNDYLHYVVILKSLKNKLLIMDPGLGSVKKIDKKEFINNWTGTLVLLVPGNSFEIRNEKTSNSSRFLHLLKPHSEILVQSLIGALIFSILGLSFPIYIQKLTDFVFINGNYNLLNTMSLGMIVIIVMQLLLGVFQTIFVLKTGQLIDSKLVLGYYKHLLKLPQRFFDSMSSGEIISRINDAIKIRSFINNRLINLIVNVLIIISSFTLMFIYSYKMAFIVLTIIPLYIGLFKLTSILHKKTERKIMEESADLEGAMIESVNTIQTIKRFNLENHFNIKTENKFIKLLNTSYVSGLNNVFSSFSTFTFSRIFTIIVLWIGSYYVLKKELTPGELLSFYAILGYFTGPLNSIINANKTIQNAYIAADRLFEIMDIDKETESKVIFKGTNKGKIRFKNVFFQYGTRVDVFENLSFDIKLAKITAIVGESGSGKSTIAHLLQNIYPIKKGKILINGIDIKEYNRYSLRDEIGIVPQTLNLFKGTLAENIAIGDLSPNYDNIIDICKKLGLHDLVNELPNGLSTEIGENGYNLSGGERQKIAIARVLYKNPSIIIFDEATSSLDPKSEELVKKLFQEMKKKGKTIITIAHRLSTILEADEIIVLEKGKIKEIGIHNELYNQKGKYYQLWQKQLPFSYS